MLSLPSHTNVYLCVQPIDLRKSFEGLCGLVASVFQRNVLDGHLFLSARTGETFSRLRAFN